MNLDVRNIPSKCDERSISCQLAGQLTTFLHFPCLPAQYSDLAMFQQLIVYDLIRVKRHILIIDNNIVDRIAQIVQLDRTQGGTI